MSKPYRRQRPDSVETRVFPIEIQREAAEQDKPKLTGYAAVFNRETVLVPADAWFKGSPEVRESIEPGAFSKSISQSDQRAIWNHNTDIVLGRRKNGTLVLWEDERGLGSDIFPPSTDLVRDMVLEPISRKDVDQMSFGFRIIRDSVTEEGGAITIRLKELDLIEVSPCTIPAYPQTEIALSARSAERIDEFRQRRLAAIQDSAPAQEGHPEETATPTETSAQPGHPTEVASVESRHLDEDMFARLEILRRKIAA